MKLFRGLMSADNGIAAHKLAREKAATKTVLQKAGFRVPRSCDVQERDAIPEELFRRIQTLDLLPGVMKPNSGSHGRNVTMNIRSLKEFRTALMAVGNSAIFEEQIEGKDYRLLTVGDSLAAATERKPAHVVGDGMSTVKQLVAQKNELRRENPSTRKHLISLVDRTCLAQQELGVESVPGKGVEVRLQSVANIGSGGEAYDRTAEVHPEFVHICEQVSPLIGGTEVLGIDIIAQDISKAPDLQKWAILELNANPDIDLHHFPWQGEPQDVADLLAQLYFPKSEIGEPLKVVFSIGGKVRLPKLAEWIERNCTVAGLAVEQIADDSGVTLLLEGTRASIDWFVEMLIRSRTGAIIRSIEYSEDPDNDLRRRS